MDLFAWARCVPRPCPSNPHLFGFPKRSRIAWYCRRRVGGHLVGRFCRSGSTPGAWWPQRDSSLSQIRGGSFPPHTCILLNAPQRPSQPPQRDDLLFLRFVQDVFHRTESIVLTPKLTSWLAVYPWPVLKWPPMAGFGWPLRRIFGRLAGVPSSAIYRICAGL